MHSEVNRYLLLNILFIRGGCQFVDAAKMFKGQYLTKTN